MASESQATPESIESELLAQTRRLKGLRPRFSKGMEGLTTMEIHALMMLVHSHEEKTMLKPSDIAHRFHVSPSAVSQFLKSLEKKGFITRSRSEGDSRSVRIGLTEKGQLLSEQIRRERTESFAGMVRYVGAEEMQQFISTLGKICDYVEESGDFVPAEGCCAAPAKGEPCA